MKTQNDYTATRKIIDKIHSEVQETLLKYLEEYRPRPGHHANALVREFCRQLQTSAEEFTLSMWLTHCISAPVKKGDATCTP